MTPDNKYKIVMLGDFAVGKTSLVKRYVLDVFDDLYLTTIGVKVMKKDAIVRYDDGARSVSMLLWDIGGIFDSGALMPQYLQGARGAIVVADLSRITKIVSIERHVEKYRAVNPGGFLAIAFNKSDVVPAEDFAGSIDSIMESYETRYDAAVFKTSARTGENVDPLFNRVAAGLLGL